MQRGLRRKQMRCQIPSTCKIEITMNKTSLSSLSPLLRLPDVLRRYPVSRTSWYDGIKLGMYPAPVRLGKRTVAWRESEIEALIQRLN